MKVRPATGNDLPWLMATLREFFDWAGYTNFFNEDYTPKFVANLVQSQLVLIAEEGERMGVIIGVLSPHPYNPDLIQLAELAWYVKPEFRRTTAGAALLTTYMEWGKKHADLVTMCTLTHSPLNPGTLEKRGFVAKETTYVWEK